LRLPVGNALEEASKRVETLLERFNAFPPDTGARADAEELVRVVSALYGDGLQRLVDKLREALGKEEANALLERCCSDPVVAGVLITHHLHPVPLEQRVQRAIESIRPYLREHDADVEIAYADEDIVEVRVNGMADVIPRIENAIREAAPEVLDVRAVGQTISLLEVR
jgi:Fe-S cluster biogenesis protein NfuA